MMCNQLGKSRKTPSAPDDKWMIRHQSHPSGTHEERPSGAHMPNPVVAQPSTPSPPSPNLPPYSRHDSPSPYTMTPRIPGTPNRHPNYNDGHHSGPHAYSHLSAATSLVDFGEEVQRLGKEIELLHQRREKWRENLTSESEVRRFFSIKCNARIDPSGREPLLTRS